MKTGSRVKYVGRVATGRGVVRSIYHGRTGAWVEVYDKTNDRTIRLRESQVKTY